MNEETAKAALKYCVKEAVPFQMTYDGNGNFAVELQSKVHANVLWGELRDKSDKMRLNLLQRPMFYRVS